MTSPAGRRERKKAQTRKALGDAALRLFLDRGFDQVSVKEVADAADVSVTTLFKHFPCKEALVFDEDDDIEASLVAAVRERAPGQTIPEALREHVLRASDDHGEELAGFVRLVAETPALYRYLRGMWIRHEHAVAHAIAEEVGAPQDDVTCAAMAHFALLARDLVEHRSDREAAAQAVFGLLENGWTTVRPGS